MKIISQIDESTFVVRMEDIDLIEQQNIYVAHDYFSVSQKASIATDFNAKVFGKFTCHGCVNMFKSCHISIRPMIEIVMPYLLQHPYMQKEHLFHKDGSEAYNYSHVDMRLCGCEKLVKVSGNQSYLERENFEYKSVLNDDGSLRYKPYYDVTRKVLRCGIEDANYKTIVEEHFTQNHTILKDQSDETRNN